MVKGEQLPTAPRRLRMPPRIIVVLGFWALVAGLFQFYAWRAALTPAELVQRLILACQTSPVGPLIFIGAAALSPLLLLPAALLGGLAGACFGPVFGIVYTLVGCNLSALLTYSLGRYSRHGHASVARLAARYGPQLQQRPIMSVIMVRLSFLPYDPMNVLMGLLRVPLWAFLMGNTLGSLPGVVLIVLAGSAMGRLGTDAVVLHPLVYIALVVLIGMCMLLAMALRKRARPMSEIE